MVFGSFGIHNFIRKVYGFHHNVLQSGKWILPAFEGCLLFQDPLRIFSLWYNQIYFSLHVWLIGFLKQLNIYFSTKPNLLKIRNLNFPKIWKWKLLQKRRRKSSLIQAKDAQRKWPEILKYLSEWPIGILLILKKEIQVKEKNINGEGNKKVLQS